jgi:hypothetical protein
MLNFMLWEYQIMWPKSPQVAGNKEPKQTSLSPQNVRAAPSVKKSGMGASPLDSGTEKTGETLVEVDRKHGREARATLFSTLRP